MDTGAATTCLRAFASGDRGAGDRLFEMLYEDLHHKAKAYFRHERADDSWQTTVLITEVWRRLFSSGSLVASDRGHFMALAARAMRQSLVDHARTRGRQKRGGGIAHVELDEHLTVDSGQLKPLDLLAIDEALQSLRERSERLARVVELKFFVGLEIEEMADVLEVDRATVVRDWSVARGLLSKYLREQA